MLRESQTGASILEFAIVVPILVLFFVGLIDLTRYVFAENLLSKSVEQIASRVRVDKRINTYWPRKMRGRRYAAAHYQVRQEIIDSGLRVSSGLFVRSDKPSRTASALNNYNAAPYRRGVANGVTNFRRVGKGYHSDALILYPGEQGIRYTSDGRETVLHPTCRGCYHFTRTTAAGFLRLLNAHPVYVEVSSQFPLFILGGRTVSLTRSEKVWVEMEPIAGNMANWTTADDAQECSEENYEAYCQEAGCSNKLQNCEYNGGHTPHCVRCVSKTCDEYWGQVAAEAGSALTPKEYFCIHNTACGTVEGCVYDGEKVVRGYPKGCGSCERQLCESLTDETTICAAKNCKVLEGEVCRFHDWKVVCPTCSVLDTCAECLTTTCQLWQQAPDCDTYTGCAADEECVFDLYAKAPDCIRCEKKCEIDDIISCPDGSLFSQKKCECCEVLDCAAEDKFFDLDRCACADLPEDPAGGGIVY